ncbi:hypothetical protein CN148_19010 [Sinorhizobium meliloti]|nr:hypothetical protein CN148_19010 [Sinorhizobium meliloti]
MLANHLRRMISLTANCTGTLARGQFEEVEPCCSLTIIQMRFCLPASICWMKCAALIRIVQRASPVNSGTPAYFECPGRNLCESPSDRSPQAVRRSRRRCYSLKR